VEHRADTISDDDTINSTCELTPAMVMCYMIYSAGACDKKLNQAWEEDVDGEGGKA
jgi:hypothetical protein